MLRLCALLVGTYVASFAATSALTAPEALMRALDRIAAPAIAAIDPPRMSRPAAPRSDRLTVAPAAARIDAPALHDLSTIEIDPEGGILVLRDARGTVLFRTDARARETEIARSVVAPLVAPLAAAGAREKRVPAGPMPTRAPERPRAPAPVEPLAPGCESPLGPIQGRNAAGDAADDLPVLARALCIAAL